MNNDRFKFRVWENGRGYLKTIDCALVADGDLIFGDRNTHTIPLAYGDDNPRIKIEMSTGLRDKNGNLIYEGDICRVKLDNGSYENVLVVWDGAAWRFQSGPWVKLICFWNAEEIEIIGNVHTEEV